MHHFAPLLSSPWITAHTTIQGSCLRRKARQKTDRNKPGRNEESVYRSLKKDRLLEKIYWAAETEKNRKISMSAGNTESNAGTDLSIFRKSLNNNCQSKGFDP